MAIFASIVAGGTAGNQSLAQGPATRPAHAPHAANPILPGYYADPSIVQHDGKIYIYVTLDPWGDQTLGCWESSDWKQWTYRELNWPTKKECTSKTSGQALVWAPSVLRGADGKFHMVVSVGNEVWAGVAETPLGPWKNARAGGGPLVDQTFRPGFHMIDAELFLDDDNQAYMYWGSGFGWVNGKCWVVKLKPDMVTFDGEVHDVTPTNYFEAPFMLKKNGRYYLMWSSGKTTEDTYEVRYGTADSPFGPFVEGATSPVLATDTTKDVISPGHHAMFEKDGRTYILYHRQSVPFDPQSLGRQTCVDELTFAADGQMQKVQPTHTGPDFVQRSADGPKALLATFTASGQRDDVTGPERVADDNYATRWTTPKSATNAWIQMDLGSVKAITSQRIRPEYAWKAYAFTVEASTDGEQWQTVADYTKQPAKGSPITVDKPVTARYLRLMFPDTGKGVALWEWAAY
jgi:beta-xylosidase